MPPPRMRAYLAGAIEYAPDGGVAWRREMAAFLSGTLGHTVHDPSALAKEHLSAEELENFRHWKTADFPRFQETVRKIIRHDLQLVLEHSDYLVCRWCEGTRIGGGTHGELTLAYWHQIPVYLMCEIPVADVSSWILGCATHVYTSWDELRAALAARYRRDDPRP